MDKHPSSNQELGDSSSKQYLNKQNMSCSSLGSQAHWEDELKGLAYRNFWK